jgi:hypothetical protein
MVWWVEILDGRKVVFNNWLVALEFAKRLRIVGKRNDVKVCGALTNK